MALDADERAARKRARELSHYITKREALALVANLLDRHIALHHTDRRPAQPPAPRWWRRLFRRTV